MFTAPGKNFAEIWSYQFYDTENICCHWRQRQFRSFLHCVYECNNTIMHPETGHVNVKTSLASLLILNVIPKNIIIKSENIV